MRLPLALALLLCACAADPVLLPDAGPCSSACGAGTVCSGGACVAVDGGSVDALQVDVGEDRPVVVDLGSPVGVGFDAGPVDAGTDAGAARDVADAGRCPIGPVAECDGRNVNLVNGERDGGAGLTFFCGACSGAGSICAAGEFCVSCRCAR